MVEVVAIVDVTRLQQAKIRLVGKPTDFQHRVVPNASLQEKWGQW